MSQRILKLNKHIQRTVGQILLEEADVPADVLVTISRVETAPTLRGATVWLYVQPIERAEEVLQYLLEQMYDIQGSFNRAVDLKPLPRLRLRIDYGAEHAQTIEERIRELKQDEPGTE